MRRRTARHRVLAATRKQEAGSRKSCGEAAIFVHPASYKYEARDSVAAITVDLSTSILQLLAMQTVTLVSSLVLVAILLLAAPQAANADCCGAISGRLCGDCTTSTPYCGHGRCNIFGCNCGGGCRNGRCNRGKRALDARPGFGSAEERVAAGDLNGDGVLTLLEAEAMLRQEGVHAANRRSVRSLDANQDGQLTIDEIDA